MDLYQQALNRFQEVLREAKKVNLPEPKAMILATVDERGQPSVRTVFLEAVDERGFVFFTDHRSRKARQLASNPRAALCCYWQPLRQQVQVEGVAELVPEEEADAYWVTRNRDGQFAAWASQQSAPLDSLEALKHRLNECRERFSFEQVPRPPHWSGFRIVPERIEFWRYGWHQLHERVCYQQSKDGWTVLLLNP